MEKLKLYVTTHWQKLLDIYIFLNFLGWTAWQAYSAIKEHRFDFIEASFFIQNVVLTSLFLWRRPSKANDPVVFHQVIAMIAFFSGALFIGIPQTSDPLLKNSSLAIILLSNVLGILTLLNLGKSFGILISYRKLQTKGLYSIVRHPMYATDILLRIGFLISHFTIYTCAIFVISTICYVYRVFLEENFLKSQTEYALYVQSVKYRFIPYIF